MPASGAGRPLRPRLFVAVVPPADVLEQVAALPRPAIAGLRWTGPEQWHVTLRFLGRVDEVAPVADALRRAGGRMTEAVVGPAVGRFGHRVLHLPVGGLDDVAGAVVAATTRLGQPPEERPFAGHLTLARVRKGARVDLRALAGRAFSAAWTVTEACLFESHLSPSGARYEVLDRFPLSTPSEGSVQ